MAIPFIPYIKKISKKSFSRVSTTKSCLGSLKDKKAPKPVKILKANSPSVLNSLKASLIYPSRPLAKKANNEALFLYLQIITSKTFSKIFIFFIIKNINTNNITILALFMILKKKKNISNIKKIIDAFVYMRKYLSTNNKNNILVNHKERILKLEESLNKFSSKQSSIIYEGKIYDANSILLDILNDANEEIIIIDNYINKELLNLLKDINIKIIMISKNFNEELIK